MAYKQLNQSGVLFTDRRDFYLSPNWTAELWQNVTPFLSMLSSKPARVTNDPDFKMFEHRDTWLDMSFTLNDATPPAWTVAGAPGDVPATDLTVDGASGLGDQAIGQHLENMVCRVWNSAGTTMKGHVKVTSYVSANTIAVKSLGNPTQGSSNQVAALADDDIFEVIGTGYPEGSTAGEGWTDELSVVYNSCQIFRTQVEITGTLYHQTHLRGYSNELARLRKIKSKEHQIMLERSFLFGHRPYGTGHGGSDSFSNILTDGSGNNERYTMGAVSAIEAYGSTSGDTQNLFSVTMSSYTYDNWVDHTEKVFRNIPSSGYKMAFVGGTVLSFFSKVSAAGGFLKNTGASIELGPWEKGPFGYNVRVLETPHGTINLVNAPLFRGRYNGYMLIVDPQYLFRVKYRPDVYKTNVKTEDDYDGIKDIFRSDCGIGFTMPEYHSLWKFS